MKMAFPRFSTALLALASAVAAAQNAAPAPPPPKSNAQIEAGEPRATMSTAPEPQAPAAPTKNAAPAAAVPAAAKAAPKSPGAADRLNLNTATVTGDREQPKVMYIVPWKSSNIGDLSGKPMNSLLDEALAPVDRDEFKREVAYFEAVQANSSQNGAANAKPKQGEK
jgi:hypothetical protein